jgi:hypothetical protein
MANLMSRSSGQVNALRSSPTITVLRIRFVATLLGGLKVRRAFQQPQHMVALEETVELADFPVVAESPEPTDNCHLVVVPKGASAEWLKNADAWIARSEEHAETAEPVVVEQNDLRIQWRPGRALVRAPADCLDDAVAALIDFAFYEGQLRVLETALEAREAQAQADVAIAYWIRRRQKKHWKRLQATVEYFAQMRLTYSRLEPRLAKGSRSLPLTARRIMTRLLRKADVEARLEALNDRLEALEELYEGATDRVADYRWYRNGHLLEICIIGLLLIEGILMSADLWIQYSGYQLDKLASMIETRAGNVEVARDLSEEFSATILKVADGNVTFVRTTTDKTTKQEVREEQTIPFAADVLIAKGKVDIDTKEVEEAGPIEGGLKNKMFAAIAEKGIKAIVVTDPTNTKIAEIYILASAAPAVQPRPANSGKGLAPQRGGKGNAGRPFQKGANGPGGKGG